MCTTGLLCLLWYRGQMTVNGKFFLLGRLLKLATRGFLKSLSFVVMAPIFAIPMLSTIYEDPSEMSTDTLGEEMFSALSRSSSSVNAHVSSPDIDDDEITSHFAKSVFSSLSRSSSSVNARVSSPDIDDDEVTSRFTPFSPASSCGSTSAFGSIIEMIDGGDEVSSA